MITPDERRTYQSMRERTRRDYLLLETRVSEELAGVKERIGVLRRQMDALLKIYEGVCERLGVENDLAAPEDEEE